MINLTYICVKQLSLSKSADSTISVSLTTLPDEVEINYTEIYKFYNFELELKFAKKGPTSLSLSLVSKNTDGNNLKAQRSVVFKTMPKALYNMYQSVMVPKAIMPPLFEPDIDINILLCDDPYGIEGWRVIDILSALGLNVTIPATLNYRIFELSIKEGTPMLSMLQGLFPFPGVSITYFNGAFYVNFQTDDVSPDVFDVCEITSKSVDTKYYQCTVTGLNSEPLYVDNQVGEGSMIIDLTGPGASLLIQTNLVGGIHGVLFESESDVKTSSYVDRMFDTYK